MTPPNDLLSRKKELRALCRTKRKAIPAEQKTAWDQKLSRLLVSLFAFRDAGLILFFHPLPGEPDLLSAAEEALKEGKTVAFPRCTDGETMRFFTVSSLEDFETGMYGIAEPLSSCPEMPLPDKHSICILPALAFDRDGYRIGYGKGYYDRFLSSFPGRRIGVAYSPFVFDTLPRGRFDRRAEMILTEKGVVYVGTD